MKKEKVVVAMSGGVDSSFAAHLCKGKGYDVIGVTMQVWPYEKVSPNLCVRSCCSQEATDDARKIAYTLNIPHYVLNFKEVFKKKIIEDFVKEYKRGRTPNPCVRCNKFIKFEVLLKKSKELGARYLATGHYARIEYDRGKKKFILKKGLDLEKDQTYFLYTLTQEQLKHLIFPVGNLTKKEVRSLAEKFNLKTSKKPESTEICFIPDSDYKKFLKENFCSIEKPGFIMDRHGRILGTHKGVAFYTIGQRKGLRISHTHPLYVLKIDSENNILIVGEEKDLYSKELKAGEVNFIYKKPEKPLRLKARIRYKSEDADALVFPEGMDRVRVVFDKPQRAITPGQSVVFYNGDIVFGGGIIDEQDN